MRKGQSGDTSGGILCMSWKWLKKNHHLRHLGTHLEVLEKFSRTSTKLLTDILTLRIFVF
jgi:hypothetical protein